MFEPLQHGRTNYGMGECDLTNWKKRSSRYSITWRKPSPPCLCGARAAPLDAAQGVAGPPWRRTAGPLVSRDFMVPAQLRFATET